MLRTDRIEIRYRLTFESPFHFGTGLRHGLVHRTVSRDAEGYLYVPGSTLKGALRECCEHLAQLFNLHARGPHGEREALSEFNPEADIVDRIFGSRFRPGQLYFDDATMIEEDRKLFDHDLEQLRPKYRAIQTQQRTQVGLSRRTRTAKPGLLYTSEFGLRNLRFEGRIYGVLRGFEFPGTQAGTYALLLLLTGLSSLDRLGGDKSSGGGVCTCEVTGLKVIGEDQQLANWLSELEALSWYAEEQKERHR